MSHPTTAHITQLDDGCFTAGDDCSVCTLLTAVMWATDGKVGPQSHAEVPHWVRMVREWAGKPHGGLLFRGHTFRAYQSRGLMEECRKVHVAPIKAEYAQNIGWGTLGRRVVSGQLAHLAVDYGVLRSGNAPTGSATYSGGHSLPVVGAHKVAHHLHVWDGDPLFDGRRDGIPDGWQDARLMDFRKAAGAWGANPPGAGHATAIFVRKV